MKFLMAIQYKTEITTYVLLVIKTHLFYLTDWADFEGKDCKNMPSGK